MGRYYVQATSEVEFKEEYSIWGGASRARGINGWYIIDRLRNRKLAYCGDILDAHNICDKMNGVQ